MGAVEGCHIVQHYMVAGFPGAFGDAGVENLEACIVAWVVTATRTGGIGLQIADRRSTGELHRDSV